MAEIPLPNPTDAAEVSQALETATSLWKRGDRAGAVIWLKRAAQAARAGQAHGRAQELARKAADLAASQEEGVEVEVDLETTVSLNDDEALSIEELPAPPMPPRPAAAPPPRPPAAPPPRRAPSAPGPAQASAAVAPVAPPRAPTIGTLASVAPVPQPIPTAKSAAPEPPRPLSLMSDDATVTEWPPEEPQVGSLEETVTEWPPARSEMATQPMVESLEETVTEWPPLPRGKGAEEAEAEPQGAAGSAPSVAPEAPGLRPRAKVATPLPLELEDDDWFEDAPPTYRPPEPPRLNPTELSGLRQIRSEPPITILQAARTTPPPPPEEPPTEPWPEETFSPPTRKMSIPTSLLEAAIPPELELGGLPEFADIPDAERNAFFAAVRRKSLGPREITRGFAVGVVVRGDAILLGAESDIPAATLATGAVLRARGTNGRPPPLRVMGGELGCELATWSEAPLAATFQSCPWIDQELRSGSNRLLALVSASQGALGKLGAEPFGQVASWLQVRALAAGEVFVHEGETAPPLAVVGLGAVELLRAGVVEKSCGAGELILAPEGAKGLRSPFVVQAAGDGAVILAVEKGKRQALQGALPAVIEWLSR